MEKIIAFRKQLQSECSFLDAWQRLNVNGRSTREMGFIRAYLRNGWNHTTILTTQALVTRDRMQELRDTAAELYRSFPTLDSLRIFCEGHAQQTTHSKEYNLYLNGTLADYWIRVNTTEGDYNLYVYSIVRENQEVA